MRQEMNGLDFLNRIEARNLVPEGPVQQVRAKLLASPTPVRATKVAKMLVDLGHLTMFQARQLIREYEREADERSRQHHIETAAQAHTTNLELEDNEDLQLAPIDEDAAAANAAPPAPSLTPAAEASDTLLPAELMLDSNEADTGPAEAPSDAMTSATNGGGAAAAAAEDHFDFFDDTSDAPHDTSPRRRAGRARRRNQWDTPLILGGGGALVALSILAVVLYFFLQRDTGEKLLKIADDHYRAGSYAQAIPNYETFLNKFPNHQEVSLARVRHGLARLRRSAETQPDFRLVLLDAEQILAEIENEQRFAESRSELASIIPEIAAGLASQAQQSNDVAVTQELVEQARTALELAANTKYVPASLRPAVRLQQIEDTVALAMREIDQSKALEKTLGSMRAAIAAGQPAQAYQARDDLLEAFPTLRGNAALQVAMRSAVEAEAASVRHISEPRDAVGEERATPIVGSLALARRRGPGQAEQAGGVLFARVEGAIYALSATSGQLLWRRAVGHDAAASPVPVASTEPGQLDVLCVDSLHHDLLRLDGRTGELQWRQPLDSSLSQLTLEGERVYVATASGGVHAFDVNSGQQLLQAVLPQSLTVAPAAHTPDARLYVIGAKGNLYVLSSEDLAPLEVVYLGHGEGTVEVAPAVVRSVVVVAENWAAENARLLVLRRTGADGRLELAQTIRLEGHVVTPLVVAGKLLVVTTNLGDSRVFDVGSDNGAGTKPLRPIADLPSEQRAPVARHLLVQQGRLWFAGDKLSRYGINQAAGRLTLEPLAETFEDQIVDDPLWAQSGLLMLVHRDLKRGTTTVTALAPESGSISWQTDVAIRPVGPPRVDPQTRQVAQVTADGSLFRFDDAALRALVQDQPTVSVESEPAGLTATVDMAEQRAVFAGPSGSRAIVTYNPLNKDRPLQSHAIEGQLAGPMTEFMEDLLVTLRDGRVVVLDPLSGKRRAEPFQPALAPGEEIAWQAVTAVGEAETRGVLVSAGKRLYRLGVKGSPARHLAAVIEATNLATSLTSPLAALGDRVFAVDQAGSLQSFGLADLQPLGTVALRGQALWGPWSDGQHLLVATEQEELVSVSGAGTEVWRTPLAHGVPVGDPLTVEGSAIFATVSGSLWKIDLATGKEIAANHTGQELASGPVAFRSRLLAAAKDGAILVLRLPEGE